MPQELMKVIYVSVMHVYQVEINLHYFSSVLAPLEGIFD